MDLTNSTEVKRFVGQEIGRAKQRLGSNSKIGISLIDYHGNFMSVTLIVGKRKAVGYAKCNPKYDEFDLHTGLSIATFQAVRRLYA